jgi:hypothetical protein
MVDMPLGACCMVVTGPRETVVELNRENQTLAGAIICSPEERTRPSASG